MKVTIATLAASIVLLLITSGAHADWCSIKAETAQYTYENRDVITKEKALATIEDTWLEARRAGEAVVSWYMLVDVQRITNDIYREGRKGEFYHHYDDPKTLYNQELYQCMVNGY